jgi:hypothetical protein
MAIYNTKNVILLGAGASMAAGLPSAAELTRHLLDAREKLAASQSISRSSIREIDKDIEWLKTVRQRMRPVVGRLNDLNHENLEDLFRLWDAERTNLEEESEKQLPGIHPRLMPGYEYPRLVRLLALALAHSPNYPSASDIRPDSVYAWLADIVARKSDQRGQSRPALITTNYDLIMEYALKSHEYLDITYSTSGSSDLRRILDKDQSSCNEIHYLKIHGSINWLRTGPRQPIMRDRARSMIEADLPLTYIAKRYPDLGSDIEMVPPAPIKDVTHRITWTDVWNEAYERISSCRKLTIVGYSFAQSDMLVHDMIRLSIARSKNLQSVFIVDPNADQVKSQFLSMFSDNFSSNIDIFCHNKSFNSKITEWVQEDIF